MGMIINVVKKQFPKVKNIDTETLNQLLKNTIASTSSKMDTTAEGDSKSEQQPPQSPKLALLVSQMFVLSCSIAESRMF